MPGSHNLTINIEASFNPAGFNQAKKSVKDLASLSKSFEDRLIGRGSTGTNPTSGMDNFVRQLANRRTKAIEAARNYGRDISREIAKSNDKIGLAGDQATGYFPKPKAMKQLQTPKPPQVQTYNGWQDKPKYTPQTRYSNATGKATAYSSTAKSAGLVGSSYDPRGVPVSKPKSTDFLLTGKSYTPKSGLPDSMNDYAKTLDQNNKMANSLQRETSILTGNVKRSNKMGTGSIKDVYRNPLTGKYRPSSFMDSVYSAKNRVSGAASSLKDRLGGAGGGGFFGGSAIASSPRGRGSRGSSLPMFSFPKETGGSGILSRFYDFGIADLTFRMMNQLITGMETSFKAKSEMESLAPLVVSKKNALISQQEITGLQSNMLSTLPKVAPKMNKYEIGSTMMEMAQMYEFSAKNLNDLMPTMSYIGARFLKEGRTTNDATLAVRDFFEGEYIRGREIGVDKTKLQQYGLKGAVGTKEYNESLISALSSISKDYGWDTLSQKVTSFNDMLMVGTARLTEFGAEVGGLAEGKLSTVFNAGMDVFGKLYEGFNWIGQKKLPGDGDTTVGSMVGDTLSTGVLGTAAFYLSGKILSGAPGLGENMASALGRGEQWDRNVANRGMYINPLGEARSTRQGYNDKLYMRDYVKAEKELSKARKNAITGYKSEFGKSPSSKDLMNLPTGYYTHDNQPLSYDQMVQESRRGKEVVKPGKQTSKLRMTAGKVGSGIYNALGGPLGIAMAGIGIAEATYSYLKDNTQLLDSGGERIQKGFNADQNRLSSLDSAIPAMKDLTAKLESNRNAYEIGSSEYNKLTGQIGALKASTTQLEVAKQRVEAEIAYDQIGLSNLLKSPLIDKGNNNKVFFSDGNGGYIDINNNSYTPKSEVKPVTGEYGINYYSEGQKKMQEALKNQELPTDMWGNMAFDSTQFKDLMVATSYKLGKDEAYFKSFESLVMKGGDSSLLASNAYTIGSITSDGIVTSEEVSSLQGAFDSIRKISGADFSDEQIAKNLPEIMKWSDTFGAGSQKMQLADEYLNARDKLGYKGDFNTFLNDPNIKASLNSPYSKSFENPILSLLGGNALPNLFSSFGTNLVPNLFDLLLPKPVSAATPTGTGQTTSDSGNFAGNIVGNVNATESSQFIGNLTGDVGAQTAEFIGQLTGTANALGVPYGGIIGGTASALGNFFDGVIGGSANSAGNPFSGNVGGSANSASRPFTGVVNGVASFFGAFSGIVNGVASFFGGGGGGGVARAGASLAKAGSNESTRNWVDPTTTSQSKTAQIPQTLAETIPPTPQLPESMQQAQILPKNTTGKEINLTFGDIVLDLSGSDVKDSNAKEIGTNFGEEMAEVLTKQLRRIGG